MLKEERQQRLLSYVNDRKKATVEELSAVLDVSKVTVRRDLDELNDVGLVAKTFGGALSKDSMLSMEIPSSRKTSLCIDEKRLIGQIGAGLVEDGDVVILDSGTTTLEIAKRIAEKRIIVITNDLTIALALASRPAVTLVLAGGVVESGVNVATGHIAEEVFSQIHANKTFLGADALSLDDGITDRSYAQLPIKRAMLKAAEQKFVVADHTKFGRHVFVHVCQLTDIDTLITDAIDPDFESSVRSLGIEVIAGQSKTMLPSEKTRSPLGPLGSI